MKHREEKAESQRQEPEARTKGRKAKGTRPGNKKQEARKPATHERRKHDTQSKNKKGSKSKKPAHKEQEQEASKKAGSTTRSCKSKKVSGERTRRETKKPAQDQGLVRPSVAWCFSVAKVLEA